MMRILSAFWLLGLLTVSESAEWFTALTSNVDDETFHYYSPVWFNSTPFNTDTYEVDNALFESYSTVFVEQVRITLDGTSDGSCGSSCTLTFALPPTHYGKYTLMDLVTMDGGVEMIDLRGVEWKNTAPNFFKFEGSSYYDKYYCHTFGLNYGSYTGSFERYSQRSRARIGVMLNYYEPVGGWRAAEGIGLTYGWSRQWTDNLGSGRVESYSAYLFRKAKVEVFGDTFQSNSESIVYAPVKIDGYSRFPVTYSAVNSTLQNTLIPRNSFVMMFRAKRVSSYLWDQVYRVGTSRHYNTLFVTPDSSSTSLYYDGRHFRHYASTTYSSGESVAPYYTGLTTGHWHQLAFTTDMNKRCIWLDGFPVYTWPYYQGDRSLSKSQERFELARQYASLAAEMSDFRFYYSELSTDDLQQLRNEWMYTRKGCGDGERDLWEQCDDGNVIDGDGCSQNCEVEDGFICKGGNSSSVQPDKCIPGSYLVGIDFENFEDNADASSIYSNPTGEWHFSVDQGWEGWDMTGTFLGTTLEDMSLGSESLASAACSEPDQYCCDDTFGKMIGGLRMCGGGCGLKSTFSNLPAHNYVRVTVQLAFIDYWDYKWVYMYADDELRMRVYKYWHTFPVVKSEACLPTVGGGSNTCRVNYCGGSYADDLTTVDIFFFHNQSTLDLKFTNTLNSATSKALGFVYLDMEVGIADDFVFQTEGAGYLTVSEEYGSHNNSKGVSLRNRAFPSYAARSGSAYSHLNIVQDDEISPYSFIEYSFNYLRAPRAYGGFYVTMLRLDRGETDMFEYNLEACIDVRDGSESCPDVKFYRMCFDSSYEPNAFQWQGSTYCDERLLVAQGTWLQESSTFIHKFASKYGHSEAAKSGRYTVQFGVWGDYYGTERDVELLLDDIKIGAPLTDLSNDCPSLTAYASPSEVNFQLDGLTSAVDGTRTLNEWNVVLLNSKTHEPLSSIQHFSDADFASYINSLDYGDMILFAHSGPLPCGSLSSCQDALKTIGGTTLVDLWDVSDGQTISGVGLVGAGIGKMPVTVTLLSDGGESTSKSDIGCHSSELAIGENFHPFSSLGGGHAPNNMTSFYSDESSLGFLGCFTYGSESDLFMYGYDRSYSITPGSCSLVCHDAGFAFGRVYYFECYCGDSYGNAYTVANRDFPVSSTGEVSNEYCSKVQRLAHPWHVACRGDFNQQCRYGTYDAWYRARSSESFNISNVAVTCENAQSATYCLYAADKNYGTYYRSLNIAPNTDYSITLDLGDSYVLDNGRIHTVSYYLESFEVLCGVEDTGGNITFTSFGTIEDATAESNGIYINPFEMLGWTCRYVKINLLSTVGPYFRIRDIRFNYFPSMAMKTKYDLFTTTYNQSYYELSRAEHYRANAFANNILPGGDFRTSFRVDDKSGEIWATHLILDYELLKSYHVRLVARVSQYNSGWFDMSDVNNFVEIEHNLGTLPWNVYVHVKCLSGENEGFVFSGLGAAMIDGSEIGNVTFGDQDYPELYGGLLFAYNEKNIRLWAPSGSNGYIINVNTGWAQQHLQSEKEASIRVRASVGSNPQYDTGWVTMRSQSPDNSMIQKDFYHSLGSLEYAVVKVYYRAVGGNNDGYVFEAVGSAQADDDGGSYGGVVFGYSDEFVRIFLPNNTDFSKDNCASGSNGFSLLTGQNECRDCETLGGYPCSHRDGYAIYVPSGFGGGTYTQMTHDVEVRVRIWTQDYNKASFVSEGIQMTSNGVSYAEIEHFAGTNVDSVYVFSRAQSVDFPMYFRATSSSAGTDIRPRAYGGVIFAFDDEVVRLWAPAVSQNDMWHAYGQSIQVGDGWGNGSTSVGSQGASVKAMFFMANEPSGMDDADTFMLDIRVEDNNEIPFLQTNDASIVEDTYGEGHLVASVYAYDVEGSVLSDFTIISGNTDDAFIMDDEGNILINNPEVIDFEKHQNFTLGIAVSDGQLTEVGYMFVVVENKNDIPILWPPYDREIREGSAVSTPVGEPLNATDTDISQSILFYMSDNGNYDDAFGITACSGQIYVRNPDALDFEGITGYNFFNLSVVVTDDGEYAGNATYIIPVDVLNRNDPPMWVKNMIMNVSENVPLETVLSPNLNQWCTDPDYGDLLSYELLSVSSADIGSIVDDVTLDTEDGELPTPVVQNTDFAVNNVTGNVTVGTHLNFEQNSEYTLYFRCTDYNLIEEQDPPNLYKDEYVRVRILDANDPPVFKKSTLTQYLYENSLQGTFLINTPVLATDEDKDDTLTYSIVENYNNLLGIDPTSGKLFQQSDQGVNYEELIFFQIVVAATDHGILVGNITVEPESTISIVNISVGDMNERPFFINSSIIMNETTSDSELGKVVGSVSGGDPDILSNQVLTFIITGSNPPSASSLFSVESSGSFSANLIVEDIISFEELPSFTLYFDVVDNGGDPADSTVSGLTDSGEVSVVVIDMNDIPVTDCSLAPASCTFSIPENSGSGLLVGNIAASDEDGDTLTWSLINPSVSFSKRFSLDPGTGDVSVLLDGESIIDYEATDVYSFTVEVRDDSTKYPGSRAMASVYTIQILDIAEQPYYLGDQNLEFGVSEDVESGSYVGAALSNYFDDQDTGSVLVYTIPTTMMVYPDSGGSVQEDPTIFSIDSSTGQIFIDATPSSVSYSVDFVLKFNATVSDGAFDVPSPITVVVLDNNAPPTFASMNCSVVENTVGPRDICSLIATDPDGDDIAFALSNSDSDYFSISVDGILSLRSGIKLNYEVVNMFNIVAIAADKVKYPQTSSAQVKVIILDENDYPSVTDYSFSIPENQAFGSVEDKTTMTFTDEDKDALHCSITSMYFAAHEVNSGNFNTSIKSVLAAGGSSNQQEAIITSLTLEYVYVTLNFDPLSSNVVMASDLSLTVTDISAHTMVLNSWPASWSASDAGTYVATFEVLSEGLSGVGTWIYSILNDGSEEASFDVALENAFDGRDVSEDGDATSCYLGLLSSLDYETQPMIELTTRVSDGKVTRYSNITINVIDVNEPPVLLDYTVNVDENSAAGTITLFSDLSSGLITVADQEDNDISFSFLSGNEDGFFEIQTIQSRSPATFAIIVAEGALIDYESQAQYNLVVKAIESSTAESYYDTASIAVIVNNVNDVTIFNVENTIKDAFGRPNAPLRTDGGDTLNISGTNFGLKSTPEDVIVTYGPTGVEYSATSCAVTPGNNVEIICLTSPGVGMEHVWRVEITSSGHSFTTTYLSKITTSYYRPLIYNVSNFDMPGEDYRTVGNERIRIVGSQFGTPGTVLMEEGFRHFTGFSKLVRFGSDFYLEDLMEKGLHKCRSALALYLADTNDQISLVSDNCPSAGEIIVTVKKKYATDKSSFSPSNIAANPCYFERTDDNDWYGINEEGRLTDFESVYDEVFVPAALAIVATSTASANLAKSCPSDAVWRTYVAGKPKMYYSNFQIATSSGVDDVSGNGSEPVIALSGGFSLLSHSCLYNDTSAVDCFTQEGAGKDYRVRYFIAGQISDEIIRPDSFVSYHTPVMLSLNGSESSLLLDTRGYTSDTPDVIYLRTIFGGSNTVFSTFGGGVISYGAVNASGEYEGGYLEASCSVAKSTTSQDSSGYWYCRESGVCRYEQVDLFTCKPVAGTGADHSWRVEVGEQQSGFADSRTSYKKPVIAFMNPDQWPFSNTAGGDSIALIGDQFGPEGGLDIYGDINVFYGSPTQFDSAELFQTVFESCSVTSAHEVISCTVGVGTGKNHSWMVEVAGQSSNIYSAASSYSPPILIDFAVYNSTTYPSSQGIPEDVQSYATEGGQFVEILGRNFGPKLQDIGYNAPIDAIAAYVGDAEDSYLWEYINCTITEAHIRMVCMTSPGVGSELKWAIKVDNQTNTVPTTSYAPPSLTEVVGVGFNISEGIDTRGGQYIDIVGENFGPDISFVERISFGPTGGEYLLFDPQSRKYNCDFLTPHKAFRCLTPEGFGQNHFFTVRVAGQKTDSSVEASSTVSYKKPRVESVLPFIGTTRGGYSIKVKGSNFGPLAGAVFSFAGVVYAGNPMSYISHEEIQFVVPEGQGADIEIAMGHRASWCADVCEQFSLMYHFQYVRPQLDRLIFSDSSLSGYSNLTLYGKAASAEPNLDGGSFGEGSSASYINDAGDSADFLNNVFVFAYNVSESYVDEELTRLYQEISISSSPIEDIDGAFAIKPCIISSDLGNTWSHDMINCLVAGSNGTVVVSGYDVSKGIYQRSDLFMFREKSPVVYSPIGISSPFPAGSAFPTTGGFTVTVSGLYFGSFTQYGSRPEGLDILLYLEDYMDYVKCLDPIVLSATNEDQETSISCTIPPGQGKNVAVIVRKGGDQSKLMSDFIVGDGCKACIDYDPPEISGFSSDGVSTARRLLSDMNEFPVYSMTTGIDKLVFFGNNFGLPGGAVVAVSGSTLSESDSHYHTNMTVSLPEGVGSNLQLSITVANHDPVTTTVDDSTNFVVNYFPPDVHAASKTMLHTSGGETIILSGVNFGRAASSASVNQIDISAAALSENAVTHGMGAHSFLRLAGGVSHVNLQLFTESRRLDTNTDEIELVSVSSTQTYTGYIELDGQAQIISSWNHTSVVLVTSEATGGVDKNMELFAGDQSDILAGLAYYPPEIVSISLDHAPTSGLTQSNKKIPVTLIGTDFGSSSASRFVTFGDTIIGSSELNATHFAIEFFVPPGQGLDVEITVTVEGQKSNTVYFTYDPPLASGLTPTIGDTDACNQWESLQSYITRLDSNPNAKRKCIDKQYLTLTGYSFGTTGVKIVVDDSLVCETDENGNVISSWNCFDCATDETTLENLCYQDHREIVFWAPQSYGSNLTVVLFVDNRRDNASIPMLYSFNPPQITVSSPGSNNQGYGFIDANGDSITIQGENLGGIESWVSINFTGINDDGQVAELQCTSAKWNEGSFDVGDGFPYLTCDMPDDIVGAKNMTIHVAGQTVYVPVRRIVDNSLFISTCMASYDDSNQQTIYYGLRYYRERCIECPEGALCKPEEYEVDPVSAEEFWLSYYDVDSDDAKEQCDKMRRPPQSSRTKCPVFEGCFPPEACTGSNTCDDAYSYVVEDCVAEREKNGLKKYNNNTCYEDRDCNKGNDICAWDKPEQCSVCDRVPGSSEPGVCLCTAAPKCSLCKIKEYYRIGGKCVKCPENVLVLIVLFVTALFCFVVGGYYLNKYKFNLAFVAIGFDYFQVLAVFAASDIVWPPLIIKMFTISLFFSFDINITAPECAFPDISYELKWYGTMLLPIMGGVMLLLMFLGKLVHKFIWRHKRGWTALTKHGNQLMAMFVIMLYYLYLPLLRKALEIVNCNPAVPDDGHLYTEWTSINCVSGVCRCWENYSDPQMQLLPYAIASLVIYAIGYPLYVTYIIVHNKELIKEDQLLRAMSTGDTRASNPMAYDVRKKYHKLYYHFKPGKVYWMILVLGRKFWIAVAALLFRSNPTFQMSFILLVMFVCYILQVKHRPFMSTVERESELERHRSKVEEGLQAQEAGERLDETMMKHLKIQRIIDTVEKKDEVQRKRIQGKRINTTIAAATSSESMKEFFWDFNNVELYLLGCAIFVCISGIMFESDTYEDNNALHYQLMFLTFLVISVIASSILYFFVVFASEVLTTFGYDTKGVFEFFMSKEFKKKQAKDAENVAEMELRHMDSNDNPMINKGPSEEAQTKQSMEMSKLADENEELMNQVAALKKKEQLARMSSFGLTGGPAIQTQKKLKKKSTFESKSSGGSFHFDDERADQL